MKSLVLKRSIVINNHKTSLSVEEPYWIDLKEIAAARGLTLSALVAEIDTCRHTRASPNSNLSSACRLFVLAEKHQRIGRLIAQALTGDRSQRHPSTVVPSGAGSHSRAMSDVSD